jgi:ligand-binding SRPBCC domain-containing protein
MAVVRQQVRLAASPAAVWRLVTDFARMPRWVVGVRRVQCEAAIPRPGVERELTILPGQSYVERFTGWEPSRSFSWSVVTLPWFAARWDARLRLVPVGSETEISWWIEVEAKGGAVGEALARVLVMPVMWLVLTASLRRLRSLCRSADAAPRPGPRRGLPPDTGSRPARS